MTDSTKKEILPLQNYRLLGNSGLRVSPLCLGAMSFGSSWSAFGIGTTKEEAKNIFTAYVDAGGNFIDTAVNYQFGESEQWLGEFMEERGNREDLVIATKYSGKGNLTDGVNKYGNNRKSILYNLELSLKRLKTTYIDVYYLHFWDHTTPIEEVMQTLHSLVVAGKILYLGISDTPAWIVAQANTIAKCNGWTPFVCYQGQYALTTRDLEQDVMPMAKSFGVGLVPWGVIGGGLLTGKYRKGKEAEGTVRKQRYPITDKMWEVIEEVCTIAEEANCSPSQVAINWCISRGTVTSALIGCRTLKQLEQNLDALKVKLTEEQEARLDKLSTPDPVFPHKMIGHSVNDLMNAPYFGGRFTLRPTL